jgi:hypothetical protein
MTRSSVLASTNLAIKFGLELAALALLAYWGAVAGTGAWAVALAVVAPAAMIGVWGTFAAPRSARRLAAPARIPLELALFALAATAGYAAGAVIAAITFAVVALVNALALTLLRQWAN